jgi:hypothetical protein
MIDRICHLSSQKGIVNLHNLPDCFAAEDFSMAALSACLRPSRFCLSECSLTILALMVPGYSCEMEEMDEDGEDAGSGATRMAAVVEYAMTIVSSVSIMSSLVDESLSVLGVGETVASFSVRLPIIFLKLSRRAPVFGDEGGEDGSVGGGEGEALICRFCTSKSDTTLSSIVGEGSGDSVVVVAMLDGSGSWFLLEPFGR